MWNRRRTYSALGSAASATTVRPVGGMGGDEELLVMLETAVGARKSADLRCKLMKWTENLKIKHQELS